MNEINFTQTATYTYETNHVAFMDGNSMSYDFDEEEFDYEITITLDDLIDYLMKQVSKKETSEMSKDELTWFRLGFRKAIEMCSSHEILSEEAIEYDEDFRRFAVKNHEREALSWYKNNR